MLLPSIIASAMIAINWGDFSILYINNPVWDIRWATRRQIRVHASLTRIENYISFEKMKLKYKKNIKKNFFLLVCPGGNRLCENSWLYQSTTTLFLK